jgi:hypothetical protein
LIEDDRRWLLGLDVAMMAEEGEIADEERWKSEVSPGSEAPSK